jgi:hypothetical protein
MTIFRAALEPIIRSRGQGNTSKILSAAEPGDCIVVADQQQLRRMQDGARAKGVTLVNIQSSGHAAVGRSLGATFFDNYAVQLLADKGHTEWQRAQKAEDALLELESAFSDVSRRLRDARSLLAGERRYCVNLEELCRDLTAEADFAAAMSDYVAYTENSHTREPA